MTLLFACAPTPAATPPPPTATPMPYPPPRLMGYRPATGEEQPLDAPIYLIFDQPMDRKSVAEAFTIIPEVEGEMTWSSDRILAFKPTRALARAMQYQVRVKKGVRNAEGAGAAEEQGFVFQTLGYLQVDSTQPMDEEQDVPLDTAIQVIFNRPIVPLTPLESLDKLPHPLIFEPPLEGAGEWINTSLYRFRPTAGLLPGTRYTVSVDEALSDTLGATLSEAYRWEFTTILPKVVRVFSEGEQGQVRMDTVISVTFNQPMDHALTEAAFSLWVDDRRWEGQFGWRTTPDPWIRESDLWETLVFTPAERLPREATCHIKIAETARAAAAPDAYLAHPFNTSFTTVSTPGILSTYPPNGMQNLPPGASIEIRFRSPMKLSEFAAHLHIEPQVTEVYSYLTEASTVLRVSFPMTPATSFRVRLDAETLDREDAPLGETLDLYFTTGNYAPYTYFATEGMLGTFNAYTPTKVYVNFRNVTRLDFKLYRLDLKLFAEVFSRYNTELLKQAPNTQELVRSWSVDVLNPPNIGLLLGVPMVDEAEAELPPGAYLVQVTSPEVRTANPNSEPSRYVFIRSQVNLLEKRGDDELVWATDLQSGKPLAGLPIRYLSMDESGWRLSAIEGHTDRDGLFAQAESQGSFVISGQVGEPDFGIAYEGWNKGIAPWNFSLDNGGHTKYRAYLYTDRPLYRPGQTVYFKGIVRRDNDARYTLPDLETVEVVVNDPNGKLLYQQELPLNDLGTFNGEVTLGEEAPLGYYSVQANGLGYTSFAIAEYRKPEYQVRVQTGSNDYINGDTINFTAEASYYFGGPVADAAVSWVVLSAPRYLSYRCPHAQRCPYYSWQDYEWDAELSERSYGEYGRSIANGKARTDAEGRFTLEFPVDLTAETGSRNLTLEVTVEDLNGQAVSGRTTVTAHRGEFYIGSAPERRVAQAGTPQSVQLLAVDWASQPVADVALQVVFAEHHWYSVRRQETNGSYYWTWDVEDIPVYTTTARTDDKGLASATFTPEKSGSYRVLVESRDRRGNLIRSGTYIWVWGGGAAAWRQQSNNRIELISDKDSYDVGDTADILITSPYSGPVYALVTVERSHILERRVIELRSNSEVFSLPIQDEHAPNVFVSVVLMQGQAQAADGIASFKMGLIALPISTAGKELHITLTPDRPIESGAYYRPREKVIYDVLVTDASGQPVEAELSLRLADLAVLALMDEPEETALERFWRPRSLGVRTGTPLVLAMERYNRDLAPHAKGGGGGGDMGLPVRSNFADTAYWAPVVRTGKDGRARVEVPLPDNLTTWRMQANAINGATQVGRAEVDVRSSLDLLVRSVLPRFFVVGDRAEIATIVHNNTATPLSAEVTVQLSGLDLDGALRRTVELTAGGEAKVVWPVTVLPTEQVRVQMAAQASQDGVAYTDARVDVLPVYRYTAPEVVALAGQIAAGPDMRQELVLLPETYDPAQGELRVQVDGSLTASAEDSLNYLKHYPYECVEQTVSRFLPNVVTYQMLKQLQADTPELRANLEEQVGIAVQRLYNFQHYDGGWGWWNNDQSNAYLTAYALQGLLEARHAGFAVDEQVIQNGAGYLRTNLALTKTPGGANRLAYQLYVLGEYMAAFPQVKPEGELNLALKLSEDTSELDQYGKAYLAAAISRLDSEHPMAQQLLNELQQDAIQSATGMYWEETRYDYWNMSTDVRSTAVIVWALSRHSLATERPIPAQLPNAVRWLMSMRKGNDATGRYWESTHTTAWVLLALNSYMEASGELKGDYSFAVWVNGRQALQGNVNADNLSVGQQVEVAIADLLAEEANRLVIERAAPRADQTGAGQLYYTAHLRYFLPAAQVPAQTRGLTIGRQYFAERDGKEVAVTQAQVGEVLRVKLTVVAPNDLHYVLIEDPLPAGCEAVDTSLKTTSVVGDSPHLRDLTAEQEDNWYRSYGWGWWWFSHTELRDEKVALFATYLPRGVYEYTYMVRAGLPGEYNVIPTYGYEMYFPEVWGRSAGMLFTITP